MLIQTIDFFPPIVDDPFVFGQIAAANAVSDIYAMGGKPTIAMNLLCIPSCLPLDYTERILMGGNDIAKKAGMIIAGGHSISDNEPKYGMSVTGIAKISEVLTNSNAKAGDVIVLTKPLGIGIMAAALKKGELDDAGYKKMIASMTSINDKARDAAIGLNPHACTDVTGFGLIGHLCEMANSSNVTITIDAKALPVIEEALPFAKKAYAPGGAKRNRSHFAKFVDMGNTEQYIDDILYDPQTSGGLLFAMEQASAEEYIKRFPDAKIVAMVTNAQGKGVVVK